MILITGSSGFIGSKLIPLVQKKYPKEKIFILDSKKHDLTTGRGLKNVPKNPKIIYHLAAATDTAKRDQRCNDLGTKNLLRQVAEIGPKTHLIFTSSQAIFSGRHDTDKFINSRTKPETNNSYGATKLLAEKFLKSEAKKRGFKLTIIRLPTVWGDNPRSNSFLNFLKKLVDKNSIFSRLNWPGKVALINVDDVANFLAKSASIPSGVASIAVENLTLAEIFEKITVGKGKIYKQVKVPGVVWSMAKALRPHLKYFENILPINLYNYLWRASIVIDSPLACKVNLKGKHFTS